MRLSFSALVFGSLAAFMPSPAHAIERQHHFGLDPTLSMLKVADKSTVSVGAGLGLHYTYGISDQFNFLATANISRVAADQEQDDPASPRTRPSDVAYATAGIGYVIDVLQFVPYFGLSLGAYRFSGGTIESPLLLPGAELTLGLDYQFNRHWAVGVALGQHLLFTKADAYPSYTTGSLRVEYMWGY